MNLKQHCSLTHLNISLFATPDLDFLLSPNHSQVPSLSLYVYVLHDALRSPLQIIFDNILNRKIPWPPVPEDMSFEAQNLIDSLLLHDPNQRLGAEGSAEVKAHPFFGGINWENLASQKAAFVPNPDSLDDTSYFVPRYSESFTAGDNDQNTSDSDADTTESLLNSDGHEKLDDCGDLAEYESSPLDLSLMNFSFKVTLFYPFRYVNQVLAPNLKNLSQLASINRDVLLQSGKDSSRCSSPYKHSTS